MNNNILIIGLGQMGQAHLKSFVTSKKKYNIYIYDIKKIENLIHKNITILKKIPDNIKFSLAIIATNSNVRFKYIKKLIKLKVKSIILEKFLFNKSNHYSFFKKLLKKNNEKNFFVNTWGNIILECSKIKLKQNNNLRIQIAIKNGSLLANISHFLDLFSILTKSKIENISFNNCKKIKSKRNKFHEITGEIKLFNKYNSLKVKTHKYEFTNIKFFERKNFHEIRLLSNGKCISKTNNKIINIFQFPFSSKLTETIYRKSGLNINEKKLNLFGNIKRISELEDIFLKLIKKKYNKINIT